jgi:serine/threonine protein kinase
MARVRLTCPECFAWIEVEQASPRGYSTVVGGVTCYRCGAYLDIGLPGTADEPEVWSVGQTLLGDYIVERYLGRGGMGRVYLVRSRSLDQRFAVKTILEANLGSELARHSFLNELQTWIDLPEHPHITACHFFRSVDDRVAIFAEYVKGGTLASWIREHRLGRMGQVLDMSIQVAWGLNAAHELGVVHQDVKPGNVLVSENGQAKITDFGLARARPVKTEPSAQAAGSPEVAVSFAGLTPAYCSPEQLAGCPLTRQTDVWSWAVSVLEMITGGPTWRSGPLAPNVLTELQEQGRFDPQSSPAEARLADVLQRCFQPDPARRWSSLAEAADALRSAYRLSVGADYPRAAPPIPSQADVTATVHARRSATGVQWRDPRDWLTIATRAAGRNPAEIQRTLLPRTGSRKAQAISDLAAYDEARGMLDNLVTQGRKDLEPKLAVLCFEKSLVHETLNDLPGALVEYDRAIVILDRLVESEGRRELAPDLATACMNKAIALAALKDLHGAVRLYERARTIQERLVEREGHSELATGLAATCLNEANARRELGNEIDAIGLLDRAIAIYQRLVECEGRTDMAHKLAITCVNKGVALAALRDMRGAVVLYERAIAIYQPLIEHQGRSELTSNLALACMNKAVALAALKDRQNAMEFYGQAIAIYERLVEREGRDDLAHRLAVACMNKGSALQAIGNRKDAVGLLDRAVAILERLVEREGRRELAGDLAAACGHQAVAVRGLGDLKLAADFHDRALALYERLVEREGRRDLASSLAAAALDKATTMDLQGDLERAVALQDQAIATYQRLVDHDGRTELAGKLAKAYMNRGVTLHRLKKLNDAASYLRRSIAIYERLVESEGRRELADELCVAWTRLVRILHAARELKAAAELGERAIARFAFLIEREGRADLAAALAEACIQVAATQIGLRNFKGALTTVDSASAICARLVERDGRRELVGDLARMRAVRAQVLSLLNKRSEARFEAQAALLTLRSEWERTRRPGLKRALDLLTKELKKF